MVIDVHAHILPECFLDMARKNEIPGVTLNVNDQGKNVLKFNGNPHPCTPVFYDEQAQLALMDAHKIDMQAICVSPRMFFYEQPVEVGAELCQIFNNEILERCKARPDRFLPVGTIPMQDAESAISELIRLAEAGVRMLHVGTTIAGKCVDDPCFLPIFQKAAELGVVIMLHPLITNADPQANRHHLGNVAGNPYQTMACAGNLIAGGVLDRIPALQIMLVHGGGALPYQLARLDHAWKVRPQAEFACKNAPSSYIQSNFWFDALVFCKESLDLLRGVAGDGRICYGTDAPYDMADYDQLSRFPVGIQGLIGKTNAEKLLGIR